jgi:hypothetical protein
MRGLDPRIHVYLRARKTWMAGSEAGHDGDRDDERESAYLARQPDFFPRTALRFRGNDE